MSRLLIFAPHPDDEILGCTALMLRRVAAGDAVHVVLVTDGGAGGRAAVREAEFSAGLAALGVHSFECWRLADGALPIDEATVLRYRLLVQQWRPDDIALPSPSETHPDHRRLTRGVLDVLTGHWSGQLWFYETTSPMVNVNHTEALPLEQKLTALACHDSQCAQFDYANLVRGIALMRGASAGLPAAEAYCCFEWDGTAQNFFEHRPLVSVIVRAQTASLVRVALDSLCEQTYDHLEVLLIWFSREPPPALPPTLRVKVLTGPGSRSANLNRGLAQASGSFVAVLDEDDVWRPEHLATLVTELVADAGLDIAYGDYTTVVCSHVDAHHIAGTQGTAGGDVVVVSEGPIQGQDHRPGRLLAGNHIAFNSFVCRRRLAQSLRFDEALDAYEDWDFFLRAELAGASFRHVPVHVCEYRVYPGEGETGDLQSLHARKGYLHWRDVVLKKIRPLLTDAGLAASLKAMADFESESNAAQQRVHKVLGELNVTRQKMQHAQRLVQAARRWAGLIQPDALGLDPVSVLAGQALAGGPCIAVILPVCDPEPAFLAEAIHSVTRQTYGNWQLCVADDASTRDSVLAMLDGLAGQARHDPRLRLARRAKRGGIVAASTSALALAQADWVVFLDHDDRLHPDALLEIVAAIRSQPALECLYTDSRTMDRNGVVLHTFNKPDWAPETLLHLNYVNHLSAVRRDVLDAVGGLRPGFDGSQDWDLWLRLAVRADLQVTHIARALYDWRATETSVAYAASAKPYVIQAACRCTTEYLLGKGLEAVEARSTQGEPGLRFQWRVALKPLTVLVPTHNNAADLTRLLDSLISADYPGLEVIVVANNVAAHDSAMQAQLQRAGEQTDWRVVVDNRAFNWASLNNAAVRLSRTPWLLFLNDDVELVGTRSLQRLVAYFMLDTRIGAVGARLVFGQPQGGGLQHDGVVTEQGWIARNIDSDIDGSGLGMPRNVSAVTGAALLTRRDLFDAVGGFDERFRMSYNDVDYCLQLRALGLRIVQASDVEWVHRESRTRGPLDTDAKRDLLAQEGQLMRVKWGEFLDEAYRLRYSGRFTATRILHVPDN